MKLILRVRDYFSTHFAPMFVVILGLIFYIVLMLQQRYLRGEYFKYLLKQSQEEEHVLISYAQQQLDETVQELLRQGSRTAVSSAVYRWVKKAEGPESRSGLQEALALSSLLKTDINGGGAIASAAATVSGRLLAQYDRLRTGNGKIMWSDSNLYALRQMGAELAALQRSRRGLALPVACIGFAPRVHPGNEKKEVFHLILPLTGGQLSSWDTPYILVNTYSVQLLRKLLDKVRIHQADYMQGYLTDEEGKVVLAGTGGPEPSDRAQLQKRKNTRIITSDLRYFGWKLNILIDETAMRAYVDLLFERAYRIHQLILALILLCALLLLYRMLRPVGVLSRVMKRAGDGDYQTKVEVRGRNEIWQVAAEYNRMLEKIQEQSEEVQRQHERALSSIAQQHEAEQEALESQINAHFICNTLGCINYEAMEAGDHEVSLLIKKLSNILRYTFDQRHQEVVIAQEIAWVDQYLYLQKMRREDLFDYRIDLQEEYEQWPCCKLMLQPFVENSILHGFEERQRGGRISISARLYDGRLAVIVEDNGCGIPPEKEQLIRDILQEQDLVPGYQRGTGIGISNVITRMRMFYAEGFEAQLETQEGKGTRFTFLLPLPGGIQEETE